MDISKSPSFDHLNPSPRPNGFIRAGKIEGVKEFLAPTVCKGFDKLIT